MKKILCLLMAIFLFQNVSLASGNVSFLYINGSNNNDEKMKNWFEKGVTKLHPVMKKSFEKNQEASALLLKNGQYSINSDARIFFWGDKSKNDLEFVEQQLDLSKAFSPTIAYGVRSLMAGFLHDAIWVQKSHHMLPIVDDLHKNVVDEYNNGNQVILFGYSAGSFITYEYLFNKLPYLNAEDLFDVAGADEDARRFISENPRKNTCISAISKAGLGAVTSDGRLRFNKDKESFKQMYLKLDEFTENACVPQGAVKGIVNFASPLVLFYSDLADSDYELTYYNRFMLKYMLENNLFMLTVNFKEDPMGFPTTKNLTVKELSEKAKIDVINPSGFVYDNSTVWSRRTFLLAHTSYWTARKIFSKAVAQSFVDGYKYMLDKQIEVKKEGL
ncbi:MAG: hypothetical protein KH301_01195 [Brachyspira sp.]|nr:hypothetical protein [Brachyspira sp.]